MVLQKNKNVRKIFFASRLLHYRTFCLQGSTLQRSYSLNFFELQTDGVLVVGYLVLGVFGSDLVATFWVLIEVIFTRL